MTSKHDRALVFFVLSLCALAYGYGMLTVRYRIFPYGLLREAQAGFAAVETKLSGERQWFFHRTRYTGPRVVVHSPQSVMPGLRLVSRLAEDDTLRAEVIDVHGHSVHKWKIDWFQLWPDAKHVPESELPKTRPGTHIHGIALLPNGDIVFNLERLGLFRLDACGKLVWRLAYQTHHSLFVDKSTGHFWVSGRKLRLHAMKTVPNYRPPFVEYTVLEVSSAGKILREISLFDLLHRNNLSGYLYMAATGNFDTETHGDTLHLNDVELFPATSAEGVFKHGDIMVSLRNVSSIFVFDEKTLRIRARFTGNFVRQHDPDFVDGNTITVLDNHNVGGDNESSRIVRIDARTGKAETVFEGGQDVPFFTSIMGKHQWLPNGNLLLTEATKGRAVEVDSAGKAVWEYRNLVDPGYTALVDEVQLLPPRYTKDFFSEQEALCMNHSSPPLTVN